MDRPRSSLSRHRRRRLLEATQHVSAPQEVGASAAIARLQCAGGDDGPETANDVVRVLRNAKNSVYNRGLAARALGLLMLRDPALTARLRLEAEDLVDALLQLVNYCRRTSVQNADTRRVHVNACLVISLLMQAPQQTSQLVVALDSELLVMQDKPVDPASACLLLTVAGRPETGSSYEKMDDDRGAQGRRSPRRADQKRRVAKPGAASPPAKQANGYANNQVDSPPKEPKLAWPDDQQQRQRNSRRAAVSKLPILPPPVKMKPPPHTTSTQSISPPMYDSPPPPQLSPSPAIVNDRLASNIASRATPARAFKMNRFRVETPAFAHAHGPVVDPAGGIGDRMSSPDLSREEPDQSIQPPPSRDQISESQASTSTPPATSLMHPDHMLEMLRTGQMPIASPAYFTRRLREDVTRQAATQPETLEPPPSRLSVVTWGEWQHNASRQGRDDRDGDDYAADAAQDPIGGATSSSNGALQHNGERRQVQPSTATAAKVSVDVANTPESRRQRLHEILASPVDPSEAITRQLRKLAQRENATTMTVLDAELDVLRRDEQGLRNEMHARIQSERDRLPLKFLFQLPGGAAYCRHRMQRAMALWILTFEDNQRRLALLQWKAMVERARFAERGAVYHRLVIKQRLQVAITFVVREYRRQALAHWVKQTQMLIWTTRDAATRVIQTRTRQFLALGIVLRSHRRWPLQNPMLRDDVCLAPPRLASSVRFRVPDEIRRDRRAFWHSAELVQSAIRRRRFRTFLARYREASIRIQAVARMRAARRWFKLTRRRLVVLQARVRMVACRTVFLVLRDAAVLVQRAFRGVRIRRLRRLVILERHRLQERRLSGALVAQRLVRGFLGRQEARRRRQYNDDKFLAALVVQRAWYRQHNEFSTFVLLGCLREQEFDDRAFEARVRTFTHNTLASHIRREWLAHRHRLRTAAALRIQTRYRARLAWNEVDTRRRRIISHRRIKWFFRVNHRHRQLEATRLQFAWLRAVPGRLRRHLANIRARNDFEDARRHYFELHGAATRLQSLVRGQLHGRKIARRERGARILQRAARRHLWRKHRRERLAELRAAASIRAANELIDLACQRVVDTTMAIYSQAATQLQRLARGAAVRTKVAAAITLEARRSAMAVRLQRQWRRSSQLRAARALIAAQRRRQASPFRDELNPTRVLTASLSAANEAVDPMDEVAGLGAYLWLWRLGLGVQYAERVHKKLNGQVDGLVAQIRSTGDDDAASARVRSWGVDDNDADVATLVTSARSAVWLREARTHRQELSRLARCAAQLETARNMQQHRVHMAEMESRHARGALDGVLREAADFRRPPQALVKAREAATKDLEAADRAVLEAQTRLDSASARHAAAEDALGSARAWFDSELAPKEATARSSLASIRVLTGEGLDTEARMRFLAKFPALEARAAAFADALSEAGQPVTPAMLDRFLVQRATVSDVKLGMGELTAFRFAAEAKRHEHARYSRCGDALQFGLERVGELFGASWEALVLGQRGERPARLVATALAALDSARRCSTSDKRADALRDGVNELVALDKAARHVQSRWRSRAAARLLTVLRVNRKYGAIREAYIADRQADRVTPLWEAERHKEAEALAAWQREEAKRRRTEQLMLLLRFPYTVGPYWSDESQAYVYSSALVESGEVLASEVAPYSLEEDDAALVMQSAGRRWLARRECEHRHRQRRRQHRRDALEAAWNAEATERSQLVTLSLGIATPQANVAVRQWWAARRSSTAKQQAQGITTMSPLDTAAQALERAYHASHRHAHRRDVLFPEASRPPNAHALGLLELLDAFQTLEERVAPTPRADTTLRFTLAALRFGWRAVASGSTRYFFEPSSGVTTWDAPAPYSFTEHAAALRMQALARQLLAVNARLQLIDASPVYQAAQDAIARAARLGWVGVGLEGLTPRAALARLGLVKHTGLLGTRLKLSTVEELRTLSASRLEPLQWTKEEIASLRLLPARVVRPRRQFPLSAAWEPASLPTALRMLPTAKAVAQAVAQAFPNQQGRVRALVAAVTSSETPVSTRQLELHLRRYAGRPDEAAAQAPGELTELNGVTRPEDELQALRALLHGLARCIALAASRRLRQLQRELSGVFLAALEGSELESHSAALPLTKLRPQELDKWRAIARAAVDGDESPKGLWEARGAELSAAQRARFVRVHGLERALRWERAARAAQALARMAPVRDWYAAVLALRRHAATTLQRVWRGHVGREERSLLELQRCSDFEQARDAATGAVYFVFGPTRERLDREPVDADGAVLPVRPLVQDRATQRWVLAWPSYDKRRVKTETSIESATMCCSCAAARAARRCLECAAPDGDYMDLCLACYSDAHALHAFVALRRAQPSALQCVECARAASQRCLPCREPYCARCFDRVHARGHRRQTHARERFAPGAAVCAECERRIAVWSCLDCRDALCERCLERSHARGARRAAHRLERIRQPLEDQDQSYCAQCGARAAESSCAFCGAQLCAACLHDDDEEDQGEDTAGHAAQCPETALRRCRRRVLGPDALCAECGKPADRRCSTCGDAYCSVRWMGHAGCFERFHARGARANHESVALDLQPQNEQDLEQLAALEAQARAFRHERARAAELEAHTLAEALAEALATEPDTLQQPQPKRKTKPRRKPERACAADGCAELALAGLGLRFCASHLTPQLALEAARGDPLEAARLLADAERIGAGGSGAVPLTAASAWLQRLGLQRAPRVRAKVDLNHKSHKKKKSKDRKTGDKKPK